MSVAWSAADRLLRGKWGTSEELASGRVGMGASVLLGLGLVGGAVYGAAMGLFGVLRPAHATGKQVLADALKLPLLFLLTLVVAFPSLYAFSALADSKLRFVQTLKLLLVAIAVNLVLLASFAPVTAFFTVSTTSYSFMVLLNVAFLVLSGAVGLAVLSKALRAVYFQPEPSNAALPPEASSEGERELGSSAEPRRAVARPRSDPRPRRIFIAWFAIYGLVGSQMGWILRPFIGAPGMEFQLFRARGGSFFEGFLTALGQFLTGR
ncbi:MAG: hypothetical protein IT454_17255 [Planctomycetes bacterium]|nr:hypothetical protein [Planctomycetota bacterium]